MQKRLENGLIFIFTVSLIYTRFFILLRITWFYTVYALLVSADYHVSITLISGIALFQIHDRTHNSHFGMIGTATSLYHYGIQK